MTNNEKQRIAEWCGWRKVSNDSWGFPAGQSPSGQRKRLPNYPHSLDDCAEFERVAKERGLGDRWALKLRLVIAREKLANVTAYDVATATPAQRVKAILRVIEEQA